MPFPFQYRTAQLRVAVAYHRRNRMGMRDDAPEFGADARRHDVIRRFLAAPTQKAACTRLHPSHPVEEIPRHHIH
ncbi:hypothetical protein GCM10027343_42370 [Noviherbaspirillum agri]